MIVLDSSAALRASLSAAARDALAKHELVAPPLLWSEVTSAIHEALWRGEVDEARAEQMRVEFSRLGLRRRSPTGIHDVAWRIADDLGWAKTYDAEFLALAQILGCQVLTTDARLRRGADRTGLVIDPTELS
jgi:predicted nucleic acid-binding protein